MDERKCQALKEQVSVQPQPWLVSVAQFFDGNDDLASIGCNLDDHPGVEAFRHVLTGLLGRPDVEAVYARIAELDPGKGFWPFTDTVLVAGTIPIEELRRAARSLKPDEVGTAQAFGVSPTIAECHAVPVLVIWWD